MNTQNSPNKPSDLIAAAAHVLNLLQVDDERCLDLGRALASALRVSTDPFHLARSMIGEVRNAIRHLSPPPEAQHDASGTGVDTSWYSQKRTGGTDDMPTYELRAVDAPAPAPAAPTPGKPFAGHKDYEVSYESQYPTTPTPTLPAPAALHDVLVAAAQGLTALAEASRLLREEAEEIRRSAEPDPDGGPENPSRYHTSGPWPRDPDEPVPAFRTAWGSVTPERTAAKIRSAAMGYSGRRGVPKAFDVLAEAITEAFPNYRLVAEYVRLVALQMHDDRSST